MVWLAGCFEDFGVLLTGGLGWALDTVRAVDPVLRTILAGVGIMLETSILIGLIVPGDSIVIVAATAVAGPVEFVALAVAVLLGALIGESLGFALGKYFGPKIRASRLGRHIGEDAWGRAENFLDRRGGIAVFVSRFLPVLHSLVPVTVGMSTMRYRKFMAWTVPASLIWSIAYTGVGAAAAGSFRQLLDQLHYAGYVFVAIILLFLLLAFVGKKLLTRASSRHMLRPGDGDANTLED